MNKTLFFILYIFIINTISFILMRIDKRAAKNNMYRIPEKVFFAISFLLGSLGTYIGMYKFRHKTKHLSFKVFIPILLIVNIICIYYIFLHFIWT